MKEFILNFLKNKYKTLGFTDKAFDGVATFLAKTITKEEDVEAGTEGIESLLKAFQSDVDKRVTDAINKTKTELAKKDEGNDDPDKDKDKNKKPDTETPDWAKAVITKLEATEAKLAQMEGKTKTETHLTTLKSKLAEANVPEKFYTPIIKGREMKEEADVEALATDIVTSWTDVAQDFTDQGLGRLGKPPVNKVDGKTVSPDVKEYIERTTNPEKANTLGGKQLIPNT